MNRYFVKISKNVIFILLPITYLFSLVGYYHIFDVYDEGIQTYGAMKILEGGIPYKDIWYYYTPGQLYLTAAAFSLFGTSLFTVDLLAAAINSSIAIIIFFIAKKFMPTRYALLAWIIFTVFSNSSPNPYSPPLLFSLASSYVLIRFLSEKKNILLFITGVLVGISMMFKYEIGIYTAVSQIIILILFRLIENRHKNIASPKITIKNSTYVFGIASIVIPTVSLITITVPFNDLWFFFITFPFKLYSHTRGLPYPLFPNPTGIKLEDLPNYLLQIRSIMPYYLHFIIFGVTIVALYRLYRKKFFAYPIILGISYFLFLGFMFVNTGLVRSDFGHVFPSYYIGFILFTILFSLSRFLKVRNQILMFIMAFIVCVSFVTPILESKIDSIVLGTAFQAPPHIWTFNLDRAKGVAIDASQGIPMQNAITYITKNVPSNEEIYVGLQRHDKVFANDVMFYFLSSRNSATKYYVLDPGIANTEIVQNNIIDDLNKHKVRYIVLWNFENDAEPNDSRKSSGVKILDDFIRENYKQVAQFGPYTILNKIKKY